MITFRVEDIKEMDSRLKLFLDFLRIENVSDDDLFDCRLVSCELITNVLRHLGEAAEFEGGISGDSIYIAVSSANTGHVMIPHSLPDVFSESGRGLYIVKEISGGKVFFDGGSVKVFIKRHL